MNRRQALASLWLCANACRRTADPNQLPPNLRALLAVGREFGEHDQTVEAEAAFELERIAAGVSSASKGGITAAFNAAVFGALGFVREITDTDLAFVLLPSVLRRRRGSCVGLGSLYLALAELLAIPASGVLLPGHFFVRLQDGGRTRNVELLRRGEELPESWYRQRYPIPGGAAPAYARALSGTEIQGVVEFDIGNQRKRQGRLQQARRAYQRATQHFPDLAEAHASLGAVLHLLGQLDDAERAYLVAEQKYPSLPGLGDNIALLRREHADSRRETFIDSNAE
jgi:tetratricopeptide (TPR) repeat protein